MKMMKAAAIALAMVLIQFLQRFVIQLLHYTRSKLVKIACQLHALLIIRSSFLEEMVLIQNVRIVLQKQDQMRITQHVLTISHVKKIPLSIMMELVKNARIT
jgi:hypothetical protein